MILLDTSFIISLLNIKDSNHNKAKSKYKDYFINKNRFYINNLVVEELINLSKTKMKVIKSDINKFINDIFDEEIEYYCYDFIAQEEFLQIIKTSLIRIYDKLSLADCSLIYQKILIDKLEIATFDKEILKLTN